MAPSIVIDQCSHSVLREELFFLHVTQGHVVHRVNAEFRVSYLLFKVMMLLVQSLKFIITLEKRLDDFLIVFEHTRTVNG